MLQSNIAIDPILLSLSATVSILEMDFELEQQKGDVLAFSSRDEQASSLLAFKQQSELGSSQNVHNNNNLNDTTLRANETKPVLPFDIALTYLAGVCLTVGSFLFLRWMSKQVTQCPPWAVGCEVNPTISFIEKHAGLVQGLVSTVHHLGLSFMAYGAACKLAETSLWPILTRQTLSLASLDHVLLATRGSLAHVPQAALSAGKSVAGMIIACVFIITALLQVESTLIGYVFTLQNVTVPYNSEYYGGGGTGLPFVQSSPPAPLPVAMTLAAGLYTSWSNGLSNEPLPLERDFLVDRLNLSQIGNFSVGALRALKDVTCQAQSLKIVTDVPAGSEAHIGLLTFKVSATKSVVTVRLQPRMTLWVDSVEYVSKTRSISTIIFAAINGTVEGGGITQPTANMSSYGYTGISAVSCQVDVELVDDQLNVGIGDASTVITTSLSTFSGPGQTISPYGPLGDVAVWLAVAITGYGTSVWGTQPMFEMRAAYTSNLMTPALSEDDTNALQLPTTYTSTTGTNGNNWTLATLLNFIDVGSGALAIAMCRQWPKAPVLIASTQVVLQIETARTYILLVPVICISALVTVLLCINIWLHNTAKLPGRQVMGVTQVVYHSQSATIAAAAHQGYLHNNGPDCIGTHLLGYTVHTDGQPGLDVVSAA